LTNALVPGSFDPPTNGHIDVVARCSALFDRVIVAVANNLSKEPLFTAEERVALLTECCKSWPNVTVESFDGLLVDLVGGGGADVIVKGLRAVTDFEYELQLAQMNRHLANVDTMFVATKPDLGYLSSSLVKEVASFGGSVDDLVPGPVRKALKERFGRD